jgi:anti-sigma B factor antagonist
MSFEARHEGPEPGRFVLAGELDLASAGALVSGVEPVIEGGVREIVLDLGEVSFLDSTGISAIISISSRLNGGSLTLEAPRPNVARVLKLVRVEAFPNVRVEWGDQGR